MKKLSLLALLVIISLVSVGTAQAQAAESLWIQTNATAYKTNETVMVTVNGNSATPIQGFTAQIRYDPSCLQPESGTSPISGMNGLAVPQQAGIADVSFASTTPQSATGVLAELRFKTLKGCQTNLTVESAALVVRSEAGLAVPIAGINIDQTPLMLNIDNAEGNPQPEIVGDSVLPLAPTVTSKASAIPWRTIGLLSLAGVILSFIIGLFVVLRPAEQR